MTREIVGIQDGYAGLIAGDYKEIKQSDFSGILTLGGTILGTRRTPFRNMRVVSEDGVDKGEGDEGELQEDEAGLPRDPRRKRHAQDRESAGGGGMNVIGLPKTIDNDIWGTDVTFGFHTAVDIATEVIDRIHTTAASHGRCMVIELMGNKAGWLTLYSGIAGGADIILLPEIPYDINVVADAVRRRAENGKAFSIVAVAEGAMSVGRSRHEEEGARRVPRRPALLASPTASPSSWRRWSALRRARRCAGPCAARRVPPSAYDRMLSTVFGVHAAQLIAAENYGQAVAMVGNTVSTIRFPRSRARRNSSPPSAQAVRAARSMGISLGD